MAKAPTVLAPDDPRHGSGTAYRYHGCRCGICTEGERGRQQKYLARPEARAKRNKSVRDLPDEKRKQRTTTHTRWAQRNPQYQRQLSWKKQGIDMAHWSWEQYLTMLEDQHARCPGCGCGLVANKHDAPAGFAVAYVDHDHTTGRVRRLLCRGCNTALGGAGDNPAVLRRLADLQEQYERSRHDC